MKCSSTYECLHQARAQLLAYHIDHRRPFKPAVIRDVLLESVSLFPNNTMFLNLCAASRSRFSIEDRVHGVADELLSRRSSSKTQSVVTLASDIASEMQRSSSSSGTQHAVRAAFERAIDRKAGKCCPALWQAYLDFETSQDRPNWKLVKDLFFRGLTQLPWCKDFILRAFSDIRTAFTDDELRRVFNVMEEKELRLHSELNDFI